MKTLKRFFFGAAALLLVLSLTVATFILFFDVNKYKDSIEGLAATHAGIQVKIEGDISLSFFPNIGVVLEKVSVKESLEVNAPEFTGFERAAVLVKVVPLLQGNIEIEGVELEKATINLRQDKKGNGNWSMLGKKNSEAPAKIDRAESKNERQDEANIPDIQINFVKASELNLNFVDQASGKIYELKDLSVEFSDFSFTKAFEIFLKTSFALPSIKTFGEIKGTTELSGKIETDLSNWNFSAHFLSVQAEIYALGLQANPIDLKTSLKGQFNLTADTLNLDDFKLSALGYDIAGKSQLKRLLNKPEFNFDFSISSKDVLEAAKILEILPNAEKLPLDIKITGKGDLLKNTLSLNQFELKSPDLRFETRAKINGLMTQPIGNFTFDGEIKNVKNFLGKALSVEIPFDKSLSLTGNGLFNLRQKTASLKSIKISAEDLNFSAEIGAKNITSIPTLSSQFNLSFQNFKKQIQDLGIDLLEMQAKSALQTFKAQGQVNYKNQFISLKKSSLEIDKNKFALEASAHLKKQQYKIKISGKDINLDNYLPPASPEKEKKKKTSKSREPIKYSKDPLLNEFILGFLRTLDFQAQIDLTQLIAKKIIVKNIALEAKAAKGKITLKKANFSVFGGQVTTGATFDVSGKTPVFKLQNSLKGIKSDEIQNFLLQKQYFTGSFSSDLKLESSGNSVYEYVHALGGSGFFEVLDGKLEEYNLDRYLCLGVALANGKSIDKKFYPEYSNFTSLNGNLKIHKGKINNDKLLIGTKSLQIEGQGVIDLPKTELNYKTEALITGNLSDPACQVNERYKNLKWPVVCSGKFHGDPVDWCRPDLAQITNTVAKIIQNEAQKALNAKIIEEKRKAQKSVEKKVNEEKKKVTGQLKKEAEKLLKNLFK